jgi:hypothetical protein
MYVVEKEFAKDDPDPGGWSVNSQLMISDPVSFLLRHHCLFYLGCKNFH